MTVSITMLLGEAPRISALMVFGLFTKTKPPPLTAYCVRLSAPTHFLKVANNAMTDDSFAADKRAVILLLIVASAAGHFVGDLQSARQPMYKELRHFLRDTNLDVVTAEAIFWIAYLMFLHWQADEKRDYEIFERISSNTFIAADGLALGLIKSKTGFDFKERVIESRMLYVQSAKDQTLVEAFASVLLRSVGCRTVADPPKTVGPLPPVEWTPLNIVVNIFFSTMPSAYYDTFKNMLRDRSDLFPHED